MGRKVVFFQKALPIGRIAFKGRGVMAEYGKSEENRPFVSLLQGSLSRQTSFLLLQQGSLSSQTLFVLLQQGSLS
ncbi:MAG: hypothetical protein KDC61_07870, partial [Saprospiraceae bacterium]|nr:hypothetical protein [Saprospiraceae bacterium]